MPHVVFKPYDKKIEFNLEEKCTLLELAIRNGIFIRSICGGKGMCKKCKVKIVEGKYKLLSDEGLIEDNYVLACQVIPLDNCIVEIPEESKLGIQKILHFGKIAALEFNPCIEKVKINGKVLIIDKLTGNKIEFDEDFTPYGLAIDIGTTKIVIYLVDLTNGQIVSQIFDINKQVIYGDDLMSRIGYCIRNANGHIDLHRVLINGINEMIHKLCSLRNIKKEHILYCAAAGNTVMTYTFVGMNPKGLADTACVVDKSEKILRASDLRLNINKNATVYCFPRISRFLGGDIIADILTSGMWRSEDIQMLIDIGTNTHIVIGCKDWYIASTGPGATAFEGYGVKFGMKAQEGAIERVKIHDDKVIYEVIGNVKPVGICGSGLIDLVAELFTNKIIDSSGRFVSKSHSRVREVDGKVEFIVAYANETSIGKDITIDEDDIKNILDSKAAVCGLAAALLRKSRIELSDVKKIYICGAFANYLDFNNAIKIGLIPEFPNAEIEYIGNGSIIGTYMLLTNYKYREVIQDIVNKLTYIDMVKDSDFLEEYEAALSIPGKKEYFPTIWKLI